MARDQAKWADAKHRWYLNVVVSRRVKWFKDNGPCVDCGTWERLELDHEDPKTKVHHSVWSWADDRRTFELAKCKARCHGCHLEKTKRDLRNMDSIARLRIVDPPGMAWCSTGHFTETENFNKDRSKRRGLNTECCLCRMKRRSPKKFARIA